MKILLSSHRYAPEVGGTETVSALLVAEWRRAGHEVTVVTASAGEPAEGVWRRPDARTLWRLVRACEVCVHSSISLRTAWPLLFPRRPWFVTTHIWLRNVQGGTGAAERLKRLALRRAHNLYISRAIAEHVGLPGEIVGNPYEAAVFRGIAGIERSGELIFVGRLVSDKGVDVLLHALQRLAGRLQPRLTIVGGGPEEETLRALARELGVDAQVTFAGVRRGEELARLLNAHRVLVVPSRWAEPFGLVAIEGMACGCRVIASAAGGLPEAVGPGGALFPNGDADALAAEIARALAAPAEAGGAVREHLARFEPRAVAARYLELFRREVRKGTA